MARKPKYLFDGVHATSKCYVRAFKDGRAEIVVQVWKSGEPEDAPDGDWAMPAALGLDVAIAQSIAQTP